MDPKQLTTFEAHRVAVEAGVDHRTVRRYLAGEPMRPSKEALIGPALRRLGFRDR
jgi:DNA-binding LacI/PurR family transcriptional regulator